MTFHKLCIKSNKYYNKTGNQNTPLLTAVIYGRAEMSRLLCEAGADVNHRRPNHYRGKDYPPDFPLAFCLQYPDIVRVLLHFGADPLMKCSRRNNNSNPGSWGRLWLPEEQALYEAEDYHRAMGRQVELRESARLLRTARILRLRFRAIFALRTLCDRGRASPTPETPAAFARLIGGGTSRPRTRAAAKVPASPGLPDPLAHLVCKFWLGEPPRRRREAPATE